MFEHPDLQRKGEIAETSLSHNIPGMCSIKNHISLLSRENICLKIL
jgi:hypothetical protein